jgi:nucleoside-diphosphate-sugar epimerase
MGRYVVTGCAGFIGSHLADALLERGDEVVGLDAFVGYYDPALKESNIAAACDRSGFKLHRADLAVDTLEPFLGDATGVFHCAAEPGIRASWTNFQSYLRNNVLASQRLFEAATSAGVRTVFASSSSVYGDAETFPVPEQAPLRPISPYGVTKLACERLAAAYGACGLDVVVLRYFTVYGPRQRPDMAISRLVVALESGSPFLLYGTGEQSRDFTYVADAVEATLAAMERAPSKAVYNVGGGEEASMNHVIALLEALSARTLQIERCDAVAGDVVRTAADCTRISRELGWTPRTGLHDGLAAQLRSRAARPAVVTGARPTSQ